MTDAERIEQLELSVDALVVAIDLITSVLDPEARRRLSARREAILEGSDPAADGLDASERRQLADLFEPLA